MVLAAVLTIIATIINPPVALSFNFNALQPVNAKGFLLV